MTISVAIISKDRKKLLTQCLYSIAIQTKKPNELILVEDVSDTQGFNKKEIQQIVGNKITVIYKAIQANNYAKSRNQCVAAASSDILLFVDDDVILPKTYLEKTVLFHEKNKKIIGVVGKIFPRTTDKIARYQAALYMGPLRFEKKIQKVTTYSFTTISLKITPIKKQKIIFNEALYAGEDYDFIIQCNKRNNHIVFSPDFKVFHQFNSDPLKFLFRYIQFGESMYELKQRYPRIFNRNSYDYPLFCNYIKYTNWDRQYMRLDKSYFILCLIHRVCLTVGIHKKSIEHKIKILT